LKKEVPGTIQKKLTPQKATTHNISKTRRFLLENENLKKNVPGTVQTDPPNNNHTQHFKNEEISPRKEDHTTHSISRRFLLVFQRNF
jgi:hypothetical protein